jgi:hypothetical protein
LETTARYSMKRCQGRTSSGIGLPRGIDEDETSDVVEVARIARAAIRYACVGLCA